MNLSPWLHRLQRRWFSAPPHPTPRPVPPCLEFLEDHVTPTTITVGAPTATGPNPLISAIDTADRGAGGGGHRLSPAAPAPARVKLLPSWSQVGEKIEYHGCPLEAAALAGNHRGRAFPNP
jgi:hypothetical protein